MWKRFMLGCAQIVCLTISSVIFMYAHLLATLQQSQKSMLMALSCVQKLCIVAWPGQKVCACTCCWAVGCISDRCCKTNIAVQADLALASAQNTSRSFDFKAAAEDQLDEMDLASGESFSAELHCDRGRTASARQHIASVHQLPLILLDRSASHRPCRPSELQKGSCDAACSMAGSPSRMRDDVAATEDNAATIRSPRSNNDGTDVPAAGDATVSSTPHGADTGVEGSRECMSERTPQLAEDSSRPSSAGQSQEYMTGSATSSRFGGSTGVSGHSSACTSRDSSRSSSPHSLPKPVLLVRQVRVHA